MTDFFVMYGACSLADIEKLKRITAKLKSCGLIENENDPQVRAFREQIDAFERENNDAIEKIKKTRQLKGREKWLHESYDPELQQLKFQIDRLNERVNILIESNQPSDETQKCIIKVTDLYQDLSRYRNAYVSDVTITREEFIANSKTAIHSEGMEQILEQHRIKWSVKYILDKILRALDACLFLYGNRFFKMMTATEYKVKKIDEALDQPKIAI